MATMTETIDWRKEFEANINEADANLCDAAADAEPAFDAWDGDAARAWARATAAIERARDAIFYKKPYMTTKLACDNAVEQCATAASEMRELASAWAMM